MKRKNNGLGSLLLQVLCVCLCLFLCAAAAASGIETDEDGGVWNYDEGTYTDPDGNTYEITPGGVQEDGSSPTGQGDSGGSSSTQNQDSGSGAGQNENGNSSVVQNPDGSITVITSDEDPNAAGILNLPADSDPTRAPLEGDDWQAVLDSMAARNGKDTPTVWTNPATGETVSVEVVYMGIGRSMVIHNGQQVLVNTVELKWETDAPEDQVLAVIRAPKNGYAWLRKLPSSEKTNPKVLQMRTDKVVRVISTGKNWTFVDYDGMRGYVHTSSLEFYANDHTDFDAGVLSVNGKTKGKNTVWIRSTDKGVRSLQECRVGTPITVFDVIDDWVEIDSCGFHCRIQSKYVTMDQETASAD